MNIAIWYTLLLFLQIYFSTFPIATQAFIRRMDSLFTFIQGILVTNNKKYNNYINAIFTKNNTTKIAQIITILLK